MKLPELRRTIEQYPQERLRLIVAELYRAMPKKMIEEKGIDQFILNTNTVLDERKKSKKLETPLEFSSVKEEVETFLRHAYQQNYFAPNREIHKKTDRNGGLSPSV